MDRDQDQVELLKRIQALEFTAVDFNLYLDTHPDDLRALNDYRMTLQELQPLREMYTQKYGPLLPTDNLCSSRWQWVDEPWPWEIDY